MYIGAVPHTPANASYVAKQKESFEKGVPPPDYPKWAGEAGFVGIGTQSDIDSPIGRKAMGFPIQASA